MEPDRIFDALASRPRRQILACLSGAQLTTSELAERFSISPPSISRHLSVLEAAGLVASERKGQRVLYRINRELLVGTLTEFALEISPESRAPKKPRESI
jgi:DNA-binding transcriptional ArsR family regulator